MDDIELKSVDISFGDFPKSNMIFSKGEDDKIFPKVLTVELGFDDYQRINDFIKGLMSKKVNECFKFMEKLNIKKMTLKD